MRAVTCCVILLLFALPMRAQCTSYLFGPNSGSSIGVRCGVNVLQCSAIVSSGVDRWNACSEAGRGSPMLRANDTGGLNIDVEVRDANSDTPSGGCAVFQDSTSNNRVIGGTIVLFTRRSDGTSCLPLDRTMAHELGHVLGLGEANCYDDRIMQPRSAQGDYREVKADECAAVAAHWTTPSEQDGGNCGVNCTVDQDWCASFPELCGCPLILDLEGDGVQTTDASAPVSFDINADGMAELLTWSGDAFLWIDLDQNHAVDGGAELFGVGTSLPNGERAPTGFAALAAYDAPAAGGNGDGRISVDDRVWGRLRLWIDANHDGVSQPTETGPIHRYGVLELHLAYVVDTVPDAAGNHHLLRGSFIRRTPGGEPRLQALDDVFFRRLAVPAE
jgi:hypothetical protein